MIRRRSVARPRWVPGSTSVLGRVRYEVLPTPSVVDAVLAYVPTEVTVTVTASPRRGLEHTLAVAEQLAGAGYAVVPHVSARLVRDRVHLQEIAARLQRAGVDDVFVPAGDATQPAGAFEGALGALVELAQLDPPFRRVGITGYPESHPTISDDVTIQSMWDKRRYADYIVSNLCFDPHTVRAWLRRVRARGVTLPVYLGLAGPVDPAKLLDTARRIGVSDSARFAGRHLRWVARLSSAPGGYRPERFLERLGTAATDPAAAIEGVHVFTFNHLREAEAWRRSLVEPSAR